MNIQVQQRAEPLHECNCSGLRISNAETTRAAALEGKDLAVLSDVAPCFGQIQSGANLIDAAAGQAPEIQTVATNAPVPFAPIQADRVGRIRDSCSQFFVPLADTIEHRSQTAEYLQSLEERQTAKRRIV